MTTWAINFSFFSSPFKFAIICRPQGGSSSRMMTKGFRFIVSQKLSQFPTKKEGTTWFCAFWNWSRWTSCSPFTLILSKAKSVAHSFARPSLKLINEQRLCTRRASMIRVASQDLLVYRYKWLWLATLVKGQCLLCKERQWFFPPIREQAARHSCWTAAAAATAFTRIPNLNPSFFAGN